MILPVVHYGDPVLRQRGADVTVFDKKLAAFAHDMLETMVANEGIGLASQQVGQARRLFVADLLSRTQEAENVLHDGKSVPPALLMPLVVVNPAVEFLPGKKHVVEEGCLSFPEIRGEVTRPYAVRLHYQDLQGKPHTLETSGLFARVIQHEFDHVEGVLFIDRMDADYLKEIDPELKKLKKQTRAANKKSFQAKSD